MAMRIRVTSGRLSSTISTCSRGDLSSSERDRETEGRTASGFGFDPDPPMMALNDAHTNGKTDSRSGVTVTIVQSSKQSKDLLLKFGCNSNSVVLHREYPGVISSLGGDMNDRSPLRISILNAVADQVLKELLEVHRLDADGGKAVVSYMRVTLFNRACKIRKSVGKSLVGIFLLVRFLQ